MAQSRLGGSGSLVAGSDPFDIARDVAPVPIKHGGRSPIVGHHRTSLAGLRAVPTGGRVLIRLEPIQEGAPDAPFKLGDIAMNNRMTALGRFLLLFPLPASPFMPWIIRPGPRLVLVIFLFVSSSMCPNPAYAWDEWVPGKDIVDPLTPDIELSLGIELPFPIELPLDWIKGPSWFEMPAINVPKIPGVPIKDNATFGSFYDTNIIPWLGVGVLVAAAAAAVVVVVGPPGPTIVPHVIKIAPLIGKLLGFSGEAGLAFIGGDSIVDKAELYRGTVISDHPRKEEDFDALYDGLVRHSKRLVTFPLPRSSSGSNALEDAMSALENFDDKQPLSVGDNRRLLKRAVSKLRWNPDVRQDALAALVHIEKRDPSSSVTSRESAKKAVDILRNSSDVADFRDAALLSLFYFILNDYKNADHYAGRAVEIAQKEDPEGYKARITLPTFISATCALYAREADYAAAMDQFRGSILMEPGNKLIPLLFSIFLDRYTLRSMNDGDFHPKVLRDAFDIMTMPALKELRLTNYLILMGRYLVHIESEKLKIKRVADASGSKRPEDLEYVKEALSTYELLLRDVAEVDSNVDVEARKVELNEAQSEAMIELLTEYKHANLDKDGLVRLVMELERRQEEG